ncbi:uncharacterized protein LOC115751713 [Rhodamnia argentea]|uniref:Uncharacterized protein LOC115751713 n=1 Tax=Rhodamnia argentea TaxID=178133 RepID=A0A8B8QH30_9MYRT|nr:uncharacterized protein LOC115751713 [Rhodamnia argentea]
MVWQRVRAHCNNQKLLKGAVVLLGVSLLVFIVASSILFNYRRLNYSSRAQAPCGLCSCVCPSEKGMFPLASECGENDVKESRLDLLKEQLSLQVTVAKETLARTKASMGDAKKTSLRFSAEAEKCTAGVVACELGRERAEAGFVEECKLAALWEKRARERGWKDSNKVYLNR